MAGTGTEQDPFQVATYADLCKVGTGTDGWNLDSYYLQVADIQCPTGENKHNFVPIGDSTNKFTGQYDGNNFRIKNLYIDRPTIDYVGLFGYCGAATLKNIHLPYADVIGQCRCGILVGCMDVSGGEIDNCSSSGSMYGTSSQVGGLIGSVIGAIKISCSHSTADVEAVGRTGGFAGQFFTDVSVTDCYATGNVTNRGELTGGFAGVSSATIITKCHATGNASGGASTGGFVGHIQTSSEITNCYAEGNVKGGPRTGGFAGNVQTSSEITNCYAKGIIEGESYDYIGGLVGRLSASTVRCSCAIGDVLSESSIYSGGEMLGGLIGVSQSYSNIENCYAMGSVIHGAKWVGGLIGGSQDGTISNCYSTGRAEGMYSGGLLGDAGSTTITNCFWDTETSGESSSAGGGTGKTTAEMKSIITYTGWDIVQIENYINEIWYIDNENDYPGLGWQLVETPEPLEPFKWAFPKIAGQPVTENLSYEEWAAFQDAINTKRAKYSLSNYSFTSVYTGDSLNAGIFNEVITAINEVYTTKGETSQIMEEIRNGVQGLSQGVVWEVKAGYFETLLGNLKDALNNA